MIEMKEKLKFLKKMSLNSRRNIPIKNIDLTMPDNVVDDFVFIKNKMIKRKRVSLNYKSCKVKTCSMCPFPNDQIGLNAKDIDIFKQLKNAKIKKNEFDMLTLYHNGNFFADNEISKELRLKIYNYINKLNIKYFVVESLPQTISEEKVKEFKDVCPNIELQVAIGVQTMNLFLREYSILSLFKDDELDYAINILNKYNYKPRIFLMFGMPFLPKNMSTTVVINDVKKIKEKYDLEEEIVICPLVSMDHTLSGELFSIGLQQDPSIKDISNLIDLLLLNKLKPKITYNSSLYKYNNDPIKRKEYERIIQKINLFNNDVLMPNENIKNIKYFFNENEVIKNIDNYIKIIKGGE